MSDDGDQPDVQAEYARARDRTDSAFQSWLNAEPADRPDMRARYRAASDEESAALERLAECGDREAVAPTSSPDTG